MPRYIVGECNKVTRTLSAAIALLLLTIAAFAANPRVQAALSTFQTLGADNKRLKAFCELMKIEEENAEKVAPSVKLRLNRLLDELGPDFITALKTAEDINPASDDRKVLLAALDRLFEKRSD